MVTVWLIILILMVAYFIFKIARMYDPTQQWKYVGSIRFLTFFGVPHHAPGSRGAAMFWTC